ncbi:MAG: 2-oxoglutarate dehydrogenase complex dihydrolipoyllysine-residue succinyltransferase [Rhizobiaceae bacterium]
MASEIRVPTLGESVTEATVGQWLKKSGEAVAADEPVVELETDKVSVEVPAPSAGVMADILVQEGETVEVGALLGMIDAAGAAASPAPKKADPAPAKNDGAKGKIVEIPVPSGGESVTEAGVGEWLKKVGEPVALDEALVELETDKAAQEVMSPVAGKLVEIVAQTGDTVEVGAILAKIEEGAAGAPAAASSPGTSQPASTTMPAAPSAQKMMTEKGIDPSSVQGTGKRGQILKEDVIKAASAPASTSTSAPAPAEVGASTSHEEAPREERVRMTRLRQTIARRLKDAQNSAAMLTTFNEVDMSAVMDLRKRYKELFEKKHGVKLGFMGFFSKAVCHALEEIPAVNAEIDGTDIIYKHFCHIGVAVGTDKGLVVPVVRGADQMSIAEVEKEIGRLGLKARDGELSMADMQGGTFTISNGGVYGSLMSTPILNAPQSGILGMHKIDQRPVVIDGEIVVRPMMYLALSYDHRIVDGKEAVTFLVRVKESLEDPERLVLDL